MMGKCNSGDTVKLFNPTVPNIPGTMAMQISTGRVWTCGDDLRWNRADGFRYFFKDLPLSEFVQMQAVTPGVHVQSPDCH